MSEKNQDAAGADQPSEWQQRIEGEWHGRPSLFDPEGNHVGYENVTRASEFENGETRYWMNTRLDATGPLRNRLELGAQFDFGVIDSDENRVYMGPDFYGTGQPYGFFVDAHYYSPGWQADLRTWNHVLPDGHTQVYSSVLHDGWAVCAVFNGVYQRYLDSSSEQAQTEIAEWIDLETRIGSRPQVLPTKERGSWSGTMEVHAADQSSVGTNQVTITHEPLSLTRARQEITWEGVLPRSYVFERTRNGANTTYDGPDVRGNARGYGRALFTSQHFTGGDVWKLKGREFLIDDSLSMSVVWEAFKGDQLTYVLHGQLDWAAES